MPGDHTDYRHRTIDGQMLHPETLMMGYGYDPQLSEGALKCPIFHTSTFVFEKAADGKSFFELAYGLRRPKPSEESGLIYSRINNPDLQVLEERLCLWDDAQSGLTFSSGMSAIATALLTYLRPGDWIAHSEPVYGGTEYLLHKVLPQFGVRRIGFAAGSAEGMEYAVQTAAANGPLKVIYTETPANPTNALVDIAACAALAREHATPQHRPLVVVDNTFLGPLWQQPLAHGADLVIYSLTKYVGGHSDLIAGSCLGAEDVIAPVRGMRTILGTMSDPMTGWLVMRSLETLKLRMTCSMKNARYVAEFLNDHPRVRQVHYLGFLEEDDPQFKVYRRLCRAPGSTFSFEIDGEEADVFRVLDTLQVAKLAVSLGGTESLVSHPGSMTHADVPAADKERMGISEGLIRISVGIEHPEDIIADLRQALAT
jgi:methionine-gamma-lyase